MAQFDPTMLTKSNEGYWIFDNITLKVCISSKRSERAEIRENLRGSHRQSTVVLHLNSSHKLLSYRLISRCKRTDILPMRHQTLSCPDLQRCSQATRSRPMQSVRVCGGLCKRRGKCRLCGLLLLRFQSREDAHSSSHICKCGTSRIR